MTKRFEVSLCFIRFLVPPPAGLISDLSVGALDEKFKSRESFRARIRKERKGARQKGEKGDK
jgi:hypothetical protein